MLKKLGDLRTRFRDVHFSKQAAPRDILATDGTKVGFIDNVAYAGGALRIVGWLTTNDTVCLRAGGIERLVQAHETRIDVSQELNIDPKVGFDITLNLTTEQFLRVPHALLSFVSADDSPTIDPIEISFLPLYKARIRTDLQFACAITKILPRISKWLISRDPALRAYILEHLNIHAATTTSQFNPDLFAPAQVVRTANADQQISIVMPVYNAFDLLPLVLDRLERHTDLPYHLILIEDASPDQQVRPFLQDWVKRKTDQKITLLENDENLGFIGSVNRGLTYVLEDPAQTGPVILFNSDAFVPAGWASRLIHPLLSNPTVASTTPMSNDAEIMNVPIQCQLSTLPEGAIDRLDAAAQRLNPDAATALLPTGVGFCMAISQRWLQTVPQLDPVFGRGYGEEVDWCQKIRAKGGHHIAVGNLFVEHRGGSSFGSAEKLAMITKNNGIVSSRYPDYDAEVQAFIKTDPLLSTRVALAVAWADTVAPGAVPVYFAHAMGGGAENWLQHRITSDLQSIGAAIVVRVGTSATWQVEVYAPTGQINACIQDTDTLVQLLNLLTKRHVIYSCGVGGQDPATLPESMLRLMVSDTDQLAVLVHDFFMVSPSYNLLGSDGSYGRFEQGQGPLILNDPAHHITDAKGQTVTLVDWQSRWHRLLLRADEITAFSNTSKSLLTAVWPDIDSKIVVKPHSLPHNITPIDPPATSADTAIGVLGGIGFQKGAAVLQSLAKARPDLNIVIVGKVDPAFTMPANVTIHGQYDPTDITKLAQTYKISDWLIPSIWPETFSYATHEALATGLPVFAFDLGAQGEAVSRAPNGHLIDLAPDMTLSTGNLTTAVIDCLNSIRRSV